MGIFRSAWDHLFATDGTTWLAVLPGMGPPSAWLRVFRLLGRCIWPNELPGGIGDRSQGDPAVMAAGSGVAGGGPAIGGGPQNGASVWGPGPRVRAGP